MKLAIGILVGFVCIYYLVPFFFGAMQKHDYEMMYQGMQDAKRRAGSFVQAEEKEYISYGERYARELEQ